MQGETETTHGAFATPVLDAQPNQPALEAPADARKRAASDAPKIPMTTKQNATIRNPTPDPHFVARQAGPKTRLKTKRVASKITPNANCEETPRRRGKVRVRHRGCKMEVRASPAEQRRVPRCGPAGGTRILTRPGSRALLPRRRAVHGCTFAGALGNTTVPRPRLEPHPDVETHAAFDKPRAPCAQMPERARRPTHQENHLGATRARLGRTH